MNYTGPKVRLSRALGIAITPKAARIMERKPYPPGQHGAGPRRRRVSGYKAQLLEKQRLRAQYNVSEKQMRRYFARAMRAKGNPADRLVSLLEVRMDALVLRGNLARTIYSARQYVAHGHLEVNGRPSNRPGHALRPGDVIRVRQRSQRMLCIREALQSGGTTPDYITVDPDGLSIQLERFPQREEIPVMCDVQQVIEFYSR
ncbi:MAG: 30S ribosomal protein S4 [Acidobacteriota bacterium]